MSECENTNPMIRALMVQKENQFCNFLSGTIITLWINLDDEKNGTSHSTTDGGNRGGRDRDVPIRLLLFS